MEAFRQELVLSHLKLARWMALKVWKWTGQRHEADELFQEGFLHLVRAAISFKPELGYKFTTWASTILRHGIMRFVEEQDGLTLAHRKAIKSGDAQQIRFASLELSMETGSKILLEIKDPTAQEFMDAIEHRAACLDLMKRSRLTSKEKEVMELIVNGKNPTVIAAEWKVARQGVHAHFQHAFDKMCNAASRSHRGSPHVPKEAPRSLRPYVFGVRGSVRSFSCCFEADSSPWTRRVLGSDQVGDAGATSGPDA